MPDDAMPRTIWTTAARLHGAAMAAGCALLLPMGLAGLGAAVAPADWPHTMSAYSEHVMPPTLGYAAWGLTAALGLKAIRHLALSVRARRLSWTAITLVLAFEIALVFAFFGTAPMCSFCGDTIVTHGPLPLIEFGDETPHASTLE